MINKKSFTFDIKREISTNFKFEAKEYDFAFLAIHLFGKIEKNNNFWIWKFDNADIAFYVFKIMEHIFQDKISYHSEFLKQNKKSFFYVKFGVSAENNQIFKKIKGLDFLINSKNKTFASSFLRSLFLLRGSVTNPTLSFYHLELFFYNETFAKKVLLLINLFFEAKILKRSGRKIIYLKNSDLISDFLNFIGASSGVLYFEDIRSKKNLNKNITKINNLDIANLKKSIFAASSVISKINKIKKSNNLNFLSRKEKIICNLRVQNSNFSLQQIANLYNKKYKDSISKSNVNHILRKVNNYML